MTIGFESGGGMVRYRQSFFGGKSKDAYVDGGYIGTVSGKWSYVDVGSVACVSVLIDGAHDVEPLRGIEDPNGWVSGPMSRLNLSGTPGVGFCLIGRAYNGVLCLECGGSDSGNAGKVRLVKLGTSPNRWSGRTVLSAWSATALPLTGTTLTHLASFLDPMTLGTSHCWGSVVIAGSENLSLDVGAYVSNQMLLWCPNIDNVNAGISVRMTDCVGLKSLLSADAPHLVHWPIGKVTRQTPINDSVGQDQWTGYPEATDQYKNWWDAAGNDGDSSYNKATTTSLQQGSGGASAATLGISGDTVILSTGGFGVGPVGNLVHRTVSGVGSKYSVAFYAGSANDQTLNDPGTSYIGVSVPLVRSSGSWTISDVDGISFGLKTLSSSHDKEERCTMEMLQWVTYSDVLPLTTTPSLGGRRRTAIC